jgi:hypothetical protein
MNAPLAALSLWLCVKYVPESRDEKAAPGFDVVGAQWRSPGPASPAGP